MPLLSLSEFVNVANVFAIIVSKMSQLFSVIL